VAEINDDVASFSGLRAMLDEAPSEVVQHDPAVEQKKQTRREKIADDLAAIGRLRSENISMTLHTRNAYLLFVGQSGINGGRITGATTTSAGLRTVWLLSGNDNPLADFTLIFATRAAKELSDGLDAKMDELQQLIDKALNAGLEFGVSGSVEPLSVALGYRSPYQFIIARLVTKFDLFVRMVKTLNSIAAMNDTNMRNTIFEFGRKLRRYFQEITSICRIVSDERFIKLTRNDWVLADTDSEAKARVDSVVKFLGAPIPSDIFTGKTVPDHGRRRVRLSDEELRFLSELAAKAEVDAMRLLNSMSVSGEGDDAQELGE
jgi:integrating conjugative element protein (TIGR03761 family)